MRVYERRPSGLELADLKAHARRNRASARFAAGRLLTGVVLVGCVVFPLGALWLLIGVALIASVGLFMRGAARAAVERPALVFIGLPKWDGTRRTAWSVEADDLTASLSGLMDGLDEELGAALMAADDAGEFTGLSRRAALEPHELPVLLAWGVGRKPRLAAEGDGEGVWIRIEPSPSHDGVGRTATVLANEGRARDVLTQVAWRA